MSQTISYCFHSEDNQTTRIDLNFADDTFLLLLQEPIEKPDWAELNHQKCSNCPLSSDDEKWCPTALALAQVLPHFSAKTSYDETLVEVETATRKISTSSTYQNGAASLFGLICATSGCEHTKFLRPLARFHLPFSDTKETVFRVLSAHLLDLYMDNQKKGNDAQPIDFQQLITNYQSLNTVNKYIAKRLLGTVEKDAAVNAVAILDSFALFAPGNADGTFEDLDDLFVVE